MVLLVLVVAFTFECAESETGMGDGVAHDTALLFVVLSLSQQTVLAGLKPTAQFFALAQVVMGLGLGPS